MGVLAFSNIHRILECYLWGDGSDGTYIQAGGAVTISGPRQYTHLTLSAGATFGPADERFAAIQVQGRVSITGNSNLQARWRPGTAGGAAVAGPAAGNPGTDLAYAASLLGHSTKSAGYGGSGAGGGG